MGCCQFCGSAPVVGRSQEELLEDTLAASAFDAGALKPRPQAVELDVVLREVLDTLSDPLADVAVAGLTAAGPVLIDTTHLKQVLYNVVSNAGKYGAPPYRLVAVTEPGVLTLRVVDHGPGVSPDFLPHLFERYSRSEDARTGPQKGTGLGLFIARALMRANGGDIAYERDPDGGSAFVLRLPRATTSPVRPDEELVRAS